MVVCSEWWYTRSGDVLGAVVYLRLVVYNAISSVLPVVVYSEWWCARSSGILAIGVLGVVVEGVCCM